MFRTPIPNAEMSRLENCGSQQLLGIFESFLKAGSKTVEYSQLSDAWGTLFSDMFLSAEELVDEMQSGEQRLGDGEKRMLREFIKADCANGGAFVLNVIKKGGNIDRAALIMIADLEDLAGIEYNGTTAIHLLVDACDKGVRPALIRMAGKRLLSRIYDRRGIPALFAIFSLSDVCMYDLDAIAKVFSRNDLRKIMNRNRTGKNALDVFTSVSMSLKSHPSLERNTFCMTLAVKSTNMEGDVRAQVHSPSQNGIITGGSQMKATGNKKAEPGESSMTRVSEPYESMMSDPVDEIGNIINKTMRTR